MRISKKQLEQLIKEAVEETMLKEYEVYVDEDGMAHDDEGGSWYVGRQYAGETLGAHELPPPPRHSRQGGFSGRGHGPRRGKQGYRHTRKPFDEACGSKHVDEDFFPGKYKAPHDITDRYANKLAKELGVGDDMSSRMKIVNAISTAVSDAMRLDQEEG